MIRHNKSCKRAGSRPPFVHSPMNISHSNSRPPLAFPLLLSYSPRPWFIRRAMRAAERNCLNRLNINLFLWINNNTRSSRRRRLGFQSLPERDSASTEEQNERKNFRRRSTLSAVFSLAGGTFADALPTKSSSLSPHDRKRARIVDERAEKITCCFWQLRSLNKLLSLVITLSDSDKKKFRIWSYQSTKSLTKPLSLSQQNCKTVESGFPRAVFPLSRIFMRKKLFESFGESQCERSHATN